MNNLKPMTYWQKLFAKAVYEADVKEIVKKFFNNLPQTWFFMPAASIYGKRGLPDFIVIVRGHGLGVETKRPSLGPKGQTAIQKDRQRKIVNAKGSYFLIWDYPSFCVLYDATMAQLKW